MERPPRYGGISSPTEAARAKSVAEFLSLLDLSRLLPTFEAALCNTLEKLLLLTPADLDAMNILGGIRNRLLKGIAALQAQRRSDSPMADAGSSSSSETPPPERRYNSTSSLYIESTITNPDMAQVCFCVALLVHDLAAERKQTAWPDFYDLDGNEPYPCHAREKAPFGPQYGQPVRTGPAVSE